MADDGNDNSEAAGSSGGPVTSEEPEPGFGVVGMLVNVSVLLVVVAVCYGIYRRWGKRVGLIADQGKEAANLPKMKRRDFTLEHLREYDGVQNPRILMAVNMKVFDVTSGKRFYGQGKQAAVITSHHMIKKLLRQSRATNTGSREPVYLYTRRSAHHTVLAAIGFRPNVSYYCLVMKAVTLKLRVMIR